MAAGDRRHTSCPLGIITKSYIPSMPTQNFGRFFPESPPPAAHVLSLPHVLLLHSLSSSQSAPSDFSELDAASPPFLHPGKSGGQSPVSAHCLGASLPGKCGTSPAKSCLTEVLYGLFRSPLVATGSFAALNPCT